MSKPAWEICEDCGEMWCNVHATHTGDFDCDCPGIEDWEMLGIDPYEAGGDLTPEELKARLEVIDAQAEA